MLSSCSSDDDATTAVPEVGERLFETNGSWTCELGESCQDVYDIEMTAGSRVSLTVSNVTGSSVVRLAIHAPNDNLGGINLLTGTAEDIECSGQDESYSFSNIMLSQDGVYKFVVTRDWGSSAGFDGNYRLTIFSDNLFEVIEQTVDDLNSLASGSTCP